MLGNFKTICSSILDDGLSSVTLAVVNVTVNRFRWFVLLFGPFPILGASISLTQWADGGTHAARNDAARNEVVATIDARHWQAMPHARDAELRAACEKSAQKLAAELGDACDVIVRAPFVIGGDLPPEELQRWYGRTIQPAALALTESYLQTTPDKPITVLLFSNRESYNAYAERLYHDRGISVYGYYKPTIRTLIMNIGTGGGTLVHELTHAMVDFDFADVPAWFNEGLASLHEQCRFRQTDERHWIEGLANWRLAKLQEAIQDDELGTIRAMISDADFRGANVGLNYAHARYFCMYLQQQGKLVEFYQAFRESHRDDPTGEKTLRRVLGEDGWKTIDEPFRRWVLTLRFER